jgi:hypothetical protein
MLTAKTPSGVSYPGEISYQGASTNLMLINFILSPEQFRCMIIFVCEPKKKPPAVLAN